MVRSKIIAGTAFPLFILGIIAAAIVFRDPISAWITDLEALEIARDNRPAVAVAVVGLQVLQVVVFIVPGEVVQIAAGVVFGIVGGAVLSTIGILVGSAVNFWVGRLLGSPFVDAITAPETRRRVEESVSRRGTRIGFFLLFVIPGIPKDILGYVAGAGRNAFRFGPFLLFSMVGRVPGIIGSAAIGASAAQGNVVLAAVLFGLAVLALVLGLFNQRRIETWITRRVEQRRQGR